MRNTSMIRQSLIAAGMMVAVAALPLGQAMAQDASSGSAMQSENRTVPGKVDDAWITTKVKSELATTKHITSTDISVSTTDGVVTLTGTVPSAHAKKHVIHVAEKVKGVKHVDANGLTVSTAKHG